jgi:hypothetical protein
MKKYPVIAAIDQWGFAYVLKEQNDMPDFHGILEDEYLGDIVAGMYETEFWVDKDERLCYSEPRLIMEAFLEPPENEPMSCKICGKRSPHGDNADEVLKKAYAIGWKLNMCPECVDAIREDMKEDE